MNARLSHVDARGRLQMVDVSEKSVTRRRAAAEGCIRMRETTLQAILGGKVGKGDVLAVARVAAIGAAKRTAELIPLCHPLPLDDVRVEIEPLDEVRVEIESASESSGLRMVVRATATARTGVEMEALCAVSTGLLTIYDMCKSVDRAMEIHSIRLLSKEGGKSGSWLRSSEAPAT